MIAVGVARPNAHGQAMTSTATEAIRPPTGLPAKSHQPKNAMPAITTTIGTKEYAAAVGSASPRML